jgi:hypothetical protein
MLAQEALSLIGMHEPVRTKGLVREGEVVGVVQPTGGDHATVLNDALT